MKLTLKRIACNPYGTFGVYIHRNIPFAVTLEPIWKNNEENISCIPAMEYTCRRIDSPRFGNTFEVMNVPGRTHIVHHKGNWDDDTIGCICLGEQFEPLNGEPGIWRSGKGFSEFMDILKDVNKFTLRIIDLTF